MPEQDKDQAPVCQICKKRYTSKGRNTSNLMAHLKEHYAELYVEALFMQKSRDIATKGKLLLIAMAAPLVLVSIQRIIHQRILKKFYRQVKSTLLILHKLLN